MRRRVALLAAGTALGLACGSGETGESAGSQAPAAPSQPAPGPGPSEPAGPPTNLIVVTLDTTRADALTPYGQVQPSSPRLARLAREGVLFEQAASSSPSTLPSHATLFTGHFPPRHGVRANAGYALGSESLTLAEILEAQGWQTGAEISAAVLSASRGLNQGFGSYRDIHAPGVERMRGRSTKDPSREIAIDERSAADITNGGIRFIDAHRDERFFLWLHYFDPHLVYVNRPEFARRLPGDDGYLAEVLYTDTELGRLLDHLERRGLRDRTLVVVTADHGEGRGQHDEATHAYLLYETTIRVPLILWGPPSLPAGRRIGSLVRTADVMPTALALLEVDVPPDLSGRSLVPLLSGESDDLGLAAYGESIDFALVFDAAPLRFARRGSWKYIHQIEPELYDLANDPDEERNLAAAHPERVEALRTELAELASGTPPGGDTRIALDDAERARLAALGYATVTDGGIAAADLDSLDVRGPAPRELMRDVDRLAKADGKLRVGRSADALPDLQQLATKYRDSETVQHSLADALLALGRHDAARDALERTVALGDCSARARISLGDLYRAADRREDQHRVLDEGVRRCREIPELLNNAAYVLATSPLEAVRDGARAVALAERAIAIRGDAQPEILDTLAAAYAESGDFERAVATSRRAVRLARGAGRPPALVALLEQSLRVLESGQPLRDE